MCPKSRDLHISQGVTCIINGRILLAKSLQGEKSGSYLGFWLRWTGPEPFFYPNWRYDASRFSRTGSAPSNSPAVSGRILLAKSLQGEKSGSYLGFWLRWTGPEPFFYPNWRYGAS